jgi:hypothetical protein
VPLLQDGKVRGPALPRYSPSKYAYGKPVPWHPATKRWWNGWRRSPQAMRMTAEADWEFLLESAGLHHLFWAENRTDLASELRLRQSKFGPTPEDRARIRMEVAERESVVTDSPAPDPRESINQRMARLAGASPRPAALDEKRSKKVMDALDEFGS